MGGEVVLLIFGYEFVLVFDGFGCVVVEELVVEFVELIEIGGCRCGGWCWGGDGGCWFWCGGGCCFW